jgi:hypothetical protein
MESRLEAYALGALDPAEAAAVRQHLESCPQCRSRLSQLRATVDELPAALAAVTPVRPHPALKQRVLLNVLAPPKRRRTLYRRLLPAVAAAAIVMVGVSGAYALNVRAQLARDQVLKQQAVEKVQTMMDPRDQARVLDVIDSSTTQKRVLRSVDPDHPEMYGKLWTRTDGTDVVAMVGRMPQPGPGAQLDLVLTTTEGRTVDAGRLKVDKDGFCLLLFAADRKGPTYRSAVVMEDSTPMVEWQGSG